MILKRNLPAVPSYGGFYFEKRQHGIERKEAEKEAGMSIISTVNKSLNNYNI